MWDKKSFSYLGAHRHSDKTNLNQGKSTWVGLKPIRKHLGSESI